MNDAGPYAMPYLNMPFRPSSTSTSTRRWPEAVLLIAMLCAALLVFFSGCNKDGTDEPVPDPGGSSVGTTLVTGIVRDRSGASVAGALVTSGSSSTTTDGNGVYLMAGVATGDRCFVSAGKDGFFNASKGVIARLGGVTQVDLMMVPSAPAFTLDAGSTEDAVLPSGAKVHLEANTVVSTGGVPVSGSYNLAVVHLDPSTDDFAAVTPGGDLLGTDVNGDAAQLLSFGMLMVSMTDNGGNELQLAPGSTATLTVPVPADMLVSAPASIPLWHFNEISGVWEEEGSATLQGSEYVGSVSHFSTWNWDQPYPGATVEGHVLDCNGAPVQGITVDVAQAQVVTDANGRYTVTIAAGVDVSVQVDQPALGLVSSEVILPPLTASITTTVPDLTVPCPAYLEGTITCSGGGMVQGFAYVSWAGGSASVPLTSTGTYRIAVPSNGGGGTLSLVGSTSGLTQSGPVVFPATLSAVVNVGSFEICGGGGGGNDLVSTFTLNGDGFSNQSFTITAIPLLASSEYSVTDDYTYAFATGSDQLIVGFPGNGTGTWTSLEGSGDMMISISVNGVFYSMYTTTLTITQYGAVGQKVIGTFSGTLERYDQVTFDPYYVTVSNGAFEFMRNPDSQ